MTAKQKKIEEYKAKIPDLLDYFKSFLNTQKIEIDTFKYSEAECNQIEETMKGYFRGHESEYLDIENYRPIYKKPVLLKKDINYDAFAAYIGEFVIHNTSSEYDIGRTKTVWEGDITWKFEGLGSCSVTPDSIIHFILRSKTEESIFQIINYFLKSNNDKLK